VLGLFARELGGSELLVDVRRQAGLGERHRAFAERPFARALFAIALALLRAAFPPFP